MTSEQALNVLIQTAVVAQKAGALSLDDAVSVRNAISVFQKPSLKKVEPGVDPTELLEENSDN